jgi:hypothetical protein
VKRLIETSVGTGDGGGGQSKFAGVLGAKANLLSPMMMSGGIYSPKMGKTSKGIILNDTLLILIQSGYRLSGIAQT